MSITVLKDSPKELPWLRGHTRVAIRPLDTGDAKELLQFFLRVPEEERFYLKEDVTSYQVIERWVQDIDYNRVMPLVALLAGRIVADATLHRHRAGARRHISEIRVVVDPSHRNQGLGTMMVRELVDIAYDNAMDSVIFELIEGEEDNAIQVAERLGFKKIASLPNFVKDLEGKPHQLVVMQLTLDDWLEW